MPNKEVDYLLSHGAGEVLHSGRPFIQHLQGTAHLLAEWGCDEDVCRAGLFHSVYGTEFFDFRKVDLSERRGIVDLIGERAEQLSYLFCVATRPAGFMKAMSSGQLLNRVTGATIPITLEQLGDLVTIECANLIEQRAGFAFFRSLVISPRLHGLMLLPSVLNALKLFLKQASGEQALLCDSGARRFLVRPAVDSDIPDLIYLGRELHVESRFCHIPFIPENAANYIAGYIHQNNRACFVVQEGEDVVAFLCGELSTLPFSTASLAVTQYWYGKHNRRGFLALRLLTMFKTWATARGAVDLQLHDTFGSTIIRSRALYEKVGMSCLGTSFSLTL